MLVRAKEKGYYGEILREPGQIFKLKPRDGLVNEMIKNKKGDTVPSGKRVSKHFTVEMQFSEIWMEKVNPKQAHPSVPAVKRGRNGVRPAGEDPSELQRRISEAEAIVDNADADQAEADAEAAEIEAAQEDADEEAEVI